VVWCSGALRALGKGLGYMGVMRAAGRYHFTLQLGLRIPTIDPVTS